MIFIMLLGLSLICLIGGMINYNLLCKLIYAKLFIFTIIFMFMLVTTKFEIIICLLFGSISIFIFGCIICLEVYKRNKTIEVSNLELS